MSGWFNNDKVLIVLQGIEERGREEGAEGGGKEAREECFIPEGPITSHSSRQLGTEDVIRHAFLPLSSSFLHLPPFLL